MKSAKHFSNRISLVLTAICLVCSTLLLSGCEWSSFLAGVKGEEQQPVSYTQDDTAETPKPMAEQKVEMPIFYNRLTGLPCDESVASCRPVSVCLGNFSGSPQYGTSAADILIEAPTEAGATRLWAITAGYKATADKFGSPAPVRSYMMPLSQAFHAVSFFAGTDDPQNAPTAYTGDYLDTTNRAVQSPFTTAQDGMVCAGGKQLSEAAKLAGYSTVDPAKSLPYQLCAPEAKVAPGSNPIRDIYMEYSATAKVHYTYEPESNTYLRFQNGDPHVDAGNAKQLSFSNIIVLLYNVTYYHTSENTTFMLDTQTANKGFCYTGGRAIPITWAYNAENELTFYDESGDTVLLNRGKTYIGMMKVTDSTKIIAK